MKIAVTSKSKDLGSEIDPRFGRAANILIVDTETFEFEVVSNEANVNAFKGAGIQSAIMISDKGAQVLITGYCGPNAFKTLKAAKIKVVDNVDGIVNDAVTKFKEGEFSFAENANVEGHW